MIKNRAGLSRSRWAETATAVPDARYGALARRVSNPKWTQGRPQPSLSWLRSGSR